MTSMHAPEQQSSDSVHPEPSPQLHPPSRQVSPIPHMVPQSPQLLGSPMIFRQPSSAQHF